MVRGRHRRVNSVYQRSRLVDDEADEDLSRPSGSSGRTRGTTARRRLPAEEPPSPPPEEHEEDEQEEEVWGHGPPMAPRQTSLGPTWGGPARRKEVWPIQGRHVAASF